MEDAQPAATTFHFSLDIDSPYKIGTIQPYIVVPDKHIVTPMETYDGKNDYYKGQITIKDVANKYLVLKLNVGPAYRLEQKSTNFCYTKFEHTFTSKRINCRPIQTMDFIIAHSLSGNTFSNSGLDLDAFNLWLMMSQFEADNANWDTYRHILNTVQRYFMDNPQYKLFNDEKNAIQTLLTLVHSVNELIASEREFSVNELDQAIHNIDSTAVNTTYPIYVNLNDYLEQSVEDMRYPTKTAVVMKYVFSGINKFVLNEPESFKPPLLHETHDSLIRVYRWPWVSKTVAFDKAGVKMFDFIVPTDLKRTANKIIPIDHIGNHKTVYMEPERASQIVRWVE